MKTLLVYLLVIAGGAAAGAVGVGSYNVLVLGEGSVDVAEDLGEGESTETEVSPEPREEAFPIQTGEAAAEDATAEDEPALAVGSEQEDDVPVEGAPPVSQVVAGTGTSVPSPQETPAPDPDSLSRVTLNYQRLARIFAAMRPEEAAPVLAQLDDEQLEGILLAMQGRNAAPILAEMEPDRVAAVSRRVLGENQ